MDTVNMHDAKSNLARLVRRAAAGETILIARAGRPVARLVPLETDDGSPPARRDFLAGRIAVPEDFDAIGSDDIANAFEIGR